MDSQIIEVLNVTRGVAWLPWAVSYFFLIGLSFGSFMLTLPYFVFGRAEHEKRGRCGGAKRGAYAGQFWSVRRSF